MAIDFLAGQKPTADELDALPKGVIARGRRNTNSSTTTSEIGVLRLDDKPILAGRIYRIYTSVLRGDNAVSNNLVGARIRYTTDGSTPTTSSSIIPGGEAKYRQTDTANPEDFVVTTTYTPTGAETLSLLLTVYSPNADTVGLLGSATNIIQIVIEDGGIDPGDDGVDI